MSHQPAPRKVLEGLDGAVAAHLMASAADVAMLVDRSGVIRDVSIGSHDLVLEGHEQWVGRSWAETVTVESRPKVEALLEDAARHTTRKWRHINHPAGEGGDVPVLYSAIQVGKDGQVVVFGRDMRPLATVQQRLVSAQQSMERDYLRLRHMETRYRLLFETVSEAVLVIDAGTDKVIEANRVAAQFAGRPVQEIVGRSFADCFDARSAAPLAAFSSQVRATGRADDIRLRLANGAEVSVAAALIRQENELMLLVRLGDHHAEAGTPAQASSLLTRVLERVPDAFVVTDKDARILAVNNAFVELCQMVSPDQLVGQPLEQWLGRSGVDVSVLTSNLKRNGVIRLYATTVQGRFGAPTEVEISATSVPDGDNTCYGFSIRDVGRRLHPDMRSKNELPHSVEQLSHLVGRVPLKDIVGETTDMIEQYCIEAALQLTRGNRASAAEMLGLSRQSLYVKLRRHGMSDPDGDN